MSSVAHNSQVTETVETDPASGITAPARRTWTFTDRESGQPTTFTCMPGCTVNHDSDVAMPTHRSDIWCQNDDDYAVLPVDSGPGPEDILVMGVTLNMKPFSTRLPQRLPLATIEVIEDHHIEDLDPDSLATIIETFAERLDALRAAHQQLVQARAQMAQEVRP